MMEGQEISRGWVEWKESDEGKKCRDGSASHQYLENRLWAAFMAGTRFVEQFNLRDLRQHDVAKWCESAFGAQHKNDIALRALRLLEEALEAFQSATIGRPTEEASGKAHMLVDYVFNRIAGNLAQECGGVGVTLLALCEAAGIKADEEESREFKRVKSKSLAHFRKRNQAKIDAGFE